MSTLDYDLMTKALAAADLAAAAGETPVGAVIAIADNILTTTYNRVETLNDATAHAEILAIKEASALLGRWRLTDCTLYVTLEPCEMCFGAIKLSRIGRLVYALGDSRNGYFSLHPNAELIKLKVESGLLAQDALERMQSFFKALRNKKKLKT